jgi:hypothetical protein
LTWFPEANRPRGTVSEPARSILFVLRPCEDGAIDAPILVPAPDSALVAVLDEQPLLLAGRIGRTLSGLDQREAAA